MWTCPDIRHVFLNLKKGMRLNHLSVSILLILTVASCREGQDTFIGNCAANNRSKQYCSCAYDIANNALNDDQFELFSAAIAGDRQRVAKISASFGFVDAGLAATRLAWVDTNVESGCRGQ